jgi:hypothetical protein
LRSRAPTIPRRPRPGGHYHRLFVLGTAINAAADFHKTRFKDASFGVACGSVWGFVPLAFVVYVNMTDTARKAEQQRKRSSEEYNAWVASTPSFVPSRLLF